MPSPIRGLTGMERLQHMRRQEFERKQKLRERTQAEEDRVEEERIAAAEAARKAEEDEAAKKKAQELDGFLQDLEMKGYTWGDLVVHVFDPETGSRDERWRFFFGVPGRMRSVLQLWLSSQNSKTARRMVDDWAVEHACNLVSKEADDITNTGELQLRTKVIDASFGKDFSIRDIFANLELHCPHLCKVLEAVGTTRRQAKSFGKSSSSKTTVCTRCLK